MTPRTPADDEFAPVIDAARAAGPTATYRTSLTALDTITGGGIRPGELWLITGRPGQGRSMLLTQLAGYLALEHQLPTYLISERDPAAVVAARLHANLARVPLGHITDNQLTDQDRQRIAATFGRLREAPLRVLAGPYARHRALDQLDALARKAPIAAVLDDPDWQTRWDLSEARQLADRGATVIAALAQDRLLHRADAAYVLDPAAALADLVVHVRHDRLNAHGQIEAEPEPGRATLTVIRNRRGPRYEFVVGFHCHLAAFFDLDPS